MKKYDCCKIVSNTEIAPGVFDFKLETDLSTQPGQFVNVYLGLGEHLLPRPISVCEHDNGVLRLVFRVVGKGTAHISTLIAGGQVKIMGALGNGFDTAVFGTSPIAIIGGGIGIPPMLGLIKAIKKSNSNQEIHAFLGFRNDTFLVDDFNKYSVVHISTDDGSKGFHGNAIDDLRSTHLNFCTAAACGPFPMLKAASNWAVETNTRLFVSTEERMACGIGACVGCAIKIKQRNDFIYKKVCVDGPIFDSSEVIW